MTDQEFEERTKTRAEETKAVSEALAILSSDDAHDTFTSTFNFVQSRMTLQSRKRDEAAKVLRMNDELNFPPNSEGLVLGCIDADFIK